MLGPAVRMTPEDLLAHPLGIADHGPAQTPPLAIQVLGGRMDDQVGAQAQGPLQGGGAEAVVHGQEAAVGVGQIRQGADIGHLRQGIGGSFQKQEPGGGPDGRRPGVQIGQVHIAGRDAETTQVLIEEDRGAAKDGAGRQDMVPDLEQPQAGGEDGGHARGGGDAALATFQGRQAFLEGPHRGIGETRVDVARLVPGEARRRLGGIGEDEAGGGEDGLAVLPFRRAMVAGADRPGGEARALQGVRDQALL
jgi:hypothetical protein